MDFLRLAVVMASLLLAGCLGGNTPTREQATWQDGDEFASRDVVVALGTNCSQYDLLTHTTVERGGKWVPNNFTYDYYDALAPMVSVNHIQCGKWLIDEEIEYVDGSFVWIQVVAIPPQAYRPAAGAYTAVSVHAWGPHFLAAPLESLGFRVADGLMDAAWDEILPYLFVLEGHTDLEDSRENWSIHGVNDGVRREKVNGFRIFTTCQDELRFFDGKVSGDYNARPGAGLIEAADDSILSEVLLPSGTVPAVLNDGLGVDVQLEFPVKPCR